ncbi:lymphocyte activation gene 3 protein isoform X2 [Hirundo rustica]|uniref:lymphocyte activation gene 3 protein isoform X2 n=1 Tax=Hirundo rustica TaxID=43150 RepID=UPI001A94BBC3|nr:lymphocyte activation gene 3 protein isoform X2 [Hirundo rustica]
MRQVSLVLFLTFTLLPFTAGHILPGLSEERSREQKVWVREGSSALLPCHLSPRKTRETSKQLPDKISVLWRRHGGSVHQEPHVVLELGYSGLQKTALRMKPRVSLQDSTLRNGNFSLRIVPVRSEDVGLYEAQVKFKTEVHSCHVELGVITVTLSPPSPVIENELLLMSCNSSHRASLVETCWSHNKHLGPTSRTFCSLSGTLSVLRPAMRDAGSWRCQLRYSDKEIISTTFNLQILGFDGPTNPVVYAAAGSAADLPCSLSYLPSAFGMSVVAAHWSHLAGGHLQDWGISPNASSRSFPLHLPTVGPGDAGQYRCTVSVGRRTISRNVTLAVVTVTPSIQGPVSEGNRLLLICSLTHSQGHESFQWRHLDSAPIKSQLAVPSPRNLEGRGSWMGPTLEIPQVSQKDMGTWECSVHGPEGRLGAVEYDLQITGAQVSSAPSLLSGQVTFGLTLTLFLLLAACVVALALQKRARTPAFPALEGMFAVNVPGKSMEANQKGKIQQTEC